MTVKDNSLLPRMFISNLNLQLSLTIKLKNVGLSSIMCS